MGDFLLDIGQKSTIGKLLTSIGLPVPHKLRRIHGEWVEQPFKERKIIIGGKGKLHSKLASAIIPAGATVYTEKNIIGAYQKFGEAYSQKVIEIDISNEVDLHADALIFDATDLQQVDELSELFDFFHPLIRKIASNGRILVFRRPVGEQTKNGAAATQSAIEGFIRSLAKEIGRKGAIAEVVSVAKGAEDRILGVVRFLLSESSVYISGQPFYVNQTVRPPKSFSFTRALEGKTALVTGAARGIGKATAKALAREGAFVVCLDRPADDEPLSKFALDISGRALLQDIYETDAAEKIQKYLIKEFGGVDIVIHNAGVTRDRTLGKMTREQWDQTLGINLGAVVKITERLLTEGLNSEGRIVCLSSIAGIAGNFGQTNYSASKAGIIGFVRQLAPKLAKNGTTINAVAPGFIETRLTAAIPILTREVARRLCNLSQSGLPEDVAQAITFLSSPGSYGITGSVVRICGGNLIGA